MTRARLCFAWFAPALFVVVNLMTAALPARPAGAAVHFNRGNDAEPETLDPQRSSTLAEAHILRDLFEGLLIQDRAGELAPGAAESWAVSADALTYTFKLRHDGQWSNGDPVTAEDFVVALRRLVDPSIGAEYANVIYPVRNAEAISAGTKPPETLGIAAPDHHTLIITLETPTPYFLDLLAHQTTLPVHRASLAAHGAAFAAPGKLVSNGAYVLAENVPGSHIRLTKNIRFHDAASISIDVVDYILVKDLAAGVRRFRAGELDFLPDVPSDQIKALRLAYGEQLMIAPLQGTIYFGFDTTKPPYNDKRVRQALSIAIDRDVLADDIASGSIIAAARFVPPGTAGTATTTANPSWQALSIIEREDRAKALLAEAGFTASRPLSVELRYNASDNNKAMAVAVADMWKQVGVTTRFVATDSRTHFAYLRDKGDYDVARAGWIADYNDPQNFLFLLESGSGLNTTRWSFPPFDRLLQAARSERDADRRFMLLRQAEDMMLDEAPLTPIAHYTGRYLVSARLSGFIPNLRAANATRFLQLAR